MIHLIQNYGKLTCNNIIKNGNKRDLQIRKKYRKKPREIKGKNFSTNVNTINNICQTFSAIQ